MPTDYDQIRAENVARYGWDTAVLELLGQLYSDRTHFIFELIQNAEDAGATELSFELLADRLTVSHDGRPFTPADVRAICGISQGSKADDITQIGKFGIGFKSVYAYTNTPVIRSGDEHFLIENYVRPRAAGPAAGAAALTVFTFPFDRPEVPAAAAAEEISRALAGLSAETLLFLRRIERIRAIGPGVATELRRTVTPGERPGRHVVLGIRRADYRTDAEWMVWSRPLTALGEPALRVEVAFAAHSEQDVRFLMRRDSSPLVVFFPTEKETFLGFLIQGPYRTTPARDNVPEGDAWNRELVSQTAALLVDVLAELRDEGLLTVDIAQALPTDSVRFSAGSMFRPLFTAVRDAFVEHRLIPDEAGGYRGLVDARLTSGAGLRELLSPEQLGELCLAPGPVAFVHESVTPVGTPLLWRYLRDQVGVGEVTPAFVVESMTEEFLSAQPDEWLARFYVFLYQHQVLWREPGSAGEEPGPARTRPIIRLRDGSQVPPFDDRGRPAVYLPGPAATQFPTVRRAVAEHPGARRFLEALGLAEPDVLAEVLDQVFPRYADADVHSLDAARHDSDLEVVARALAEVAPASRDRLLAELAQTAFLIGENAGTGERRMMLPGELYLRSGVLEAYFDGNPDAWFAADSYGPWLAQLGAMGVRDSVRLSARDPDALGYVVIADEFARHERGIAGFDPDAALDGFGYAVAHPNLRRSEVVWNRLLVPNRHLIAGIVERSPRLGFADARQDSALSLIGELATEAAWLPARDGTFRRPAEVDVADLPESFQRDDGVAAALGMTRPVIDEANKLLGFPPGFLRRLGGHPDLVADIERELRSRES